jgi:hypothetical protein
MPTLKDRLHEWTDSDWAEHALAVVLGLAEDSHEGFQAMKGVYWSNAGDWLYDLLMEMVAQGYLILDRERDRFKWREE